MRLALIVALAGLGSAIVACSSSRYSSICCCGLRETNSAAPDGVDRYVEIVNCQQVDEASTYSVIGYLKRRNVKMILAGGLGYAFVSVPENQYARADDLLRTAPDWVIGRTSRGLAKNRSQYPLVYEHGETRCAGQFDSEVPRLLGLVSSKLRLPPESIEWARVESRQALLPNGESSNCREGEVGIHSTGDVIWFQEYNGKVIIQER